MLKIARRWAHWRTWGPYALGLGGMVLLLGCLAAISLYRERVRQHERALALTQDASRLLEAHVSEVFSKVDAILQAAVLQMGDLQAPNTPDASQIQQALQTYRRAAPEILHLLVCDEQGQVRLSSGMGPGPLPSLLGSPEFQHLQARDAAEAVLSGPYRLSPQGPWVMRLSRRLASPQGQPAGMVSADVALRHFDRSFQSVRLGLQGAATLRTEDLGLVYRRPWPTDEARALGGREVSAELRRMISSQPLAGDYSSTTQLDGIRRVNAYRKVQGYPLYVLVGIAEDEYPRGWNSLDLSVLTLAATTAVLGLLTTLALYRNSQRRIDAATRQFEALVTSSDDAIVSKTLDGQITSWNAGATRMFGYQAQEMIGQPMLRLFPADRRSEEDSILRRVQQGERVTHFDTERLRKDGQRIAVSVSISPVIDAQGQISGAAMIARDITHQKALEAELRSLAFHDALTRLPNRRLLLDRLRHAQETSQRQQSHGAVLFVDLDHFKQLNDGHGHDVGDQLLIEVSRRLRECVRESDTVARLGGDEFVVLCEHLGADRESAFQSMQGMMDKLAEAVAQPCLLADAPYHCNASIGYRLFLGTQDHPEQLIRDADMAMYHQKEQHHSVSGAPLP